MAAIGVNFGKFLNILHTMKRRKANRIGHILRSKCLLKHGVEGKIKGREDVQEDVSSYCITLRKREDTGSLKQQH